jgi:hypothetical protein
MASLFRYNFRPDFKGYDFQGWRRFASAGDSGLIIASWPRGNRPAKPLSYHSETMTGFEYAAAALMIQAGQLDQGFRVFNAVRGRYDGRARNEWSMAPGGDPFDEIEWGRYYFRAMSSWSVLPAVQGFAYDGPAGRIAFRPVFRPADHASFFSAAEGWGLFSQTASGARQVATLDLRYGTLKLRQLGLAAQPSVAMRNVQVTLNGNSVASRATWEGSSVAIAFDTPLSLSAGDKLTAAFGDPSRLAAASSEDGLRVRVRPGYLEIVPPPGWVGLRAGLWDVSGKRWALGLVRKSGAYGARLPAGLPAGRYALQVLSGTRRIVRPLILTP